MNQLDRFSNANGILDGNEIRKATSIQRSALRGIAERIIAAQEERCGAEGEAVKGNFAHMAFVDHAPCMSVEDEADLLLPPRYAEFSGVCVKDKFFMGTQARPAGRCVLKPRMIPGSQCKVHGGGSNFFPKDPEDGNVCKLLTRVSSEEGIEEAN